MANTDGVKSALDAWTAAYKQTRNVVQADAALSAFHVSAWKTSQLLDLAELVWNVIENFKESESEEEEDESEEEEFESAEEENESAEESESDAKENESEAGDGELEVNSEAEDEEEAWIRKYTYQQIYTSRKEPSMKKEADDDAGVKFLDLLWKRSEKEPRVLLKLLWGAATYWEAGSVMDIDDGGSSLAGVIDQWYKVHPDLELAKVLISRLTTSEKWGPSELTDLWNHTGALKVAWKSFDMPEMARLMRPAIKNERARFRSFSSYDNDESGSDEGEEEESDDEDDKSEGEFEEVYDIEGMFKSAATLLELTPQQQKDLFQAAAKKLFYPEMLAYLCEEALDLKFTTSEWQDLVRDETPEMQADFVQQLLEEEAYWCWEEFPRSSVQSNLARHASTCSNSAKRGCLRRQCGGCCKKAPGGACAVHLGAVPPAPRAPMTGQCVGLVGGELGAASVSIGAFPAAPTNVAAMYREPIYTAQETRVVNSAAELEEALKRGGGVKRVVLRDFHVKDEQFARLVAVFGAGLECLEMSDGEGYQLSGEAIQGMAAACPKLRKFTMESAHNIKDDTFAVLFRSCPELEYLMIAGNDKISGQLSDKSLKLLQTDATLVPKLRKLYVVDQRMSRKAAEKAVKVRSWLFIQGGESDGESCASMMVMQEMGGSFGDGLWEVGAGVKPPSFGFGGYSSYDFY